MPFKQLEHPADYRILVTGKTLPALFLSALEGMNAWLKHDYAFVKGNEKISLTLEADDSTQLLIDFLNAVLTQTLTHRMIFSRAYFFRLTEQALQVDLFGQQVAGFDNDIKGVTYHQAQVKLNGADQWETEIIFDI